MQAASARTYRSLYLPVKEGHVLLLSLSARFHPWVTLSAKKKPNLGEEPNATPFELFALLLFELPLLFTLQKLVEEEANGERSHQFAALRFTGHNLWNFKADVYICVYQHRAHP